jgi:hypothetical protein
VLNQRGRHAKGRAGDGDGAVMKERQLAWALAGGIPVDALEERRGGPSWVLKREHQRRNLYRPDWWDYIAGYEHRWARALNSSQCFAVNLFAPLKETSDWARRTLNALLPGQDLQVGDDVTVNFEHREPNAKDWLGERGQPTQIDVYFKVDRGGRCVGHVVVEAKFTEPEFGCCRGWSDSEHKPSANQDRDRCLDLPGILKESKRNCWLAANEGRRYWELMAARDSTIHLDVAEQRPCPFRRGLYQLMRNRVLADELRRRTGAAWSEFAVCRHPDNLTLLKMKHAERGTTNPIDAFRAISAPGAVRDWPADQVLAAIAASDPNLAEDAWMRRRYFDAA